MISTAVVHILLVEDDPDQASLFARVLSKVGYQVEVALNAESALVLLGETAFVLLLADWDLPGIKGDALVTTVKGQHPGVKAILFSNHPLVEEAATASGADAWFRKSDDIFRLRKMVTELAPCHA